MLLALQTTISAISPTPSPTSAISNASTASQTGDGFLISLLSIVLSGIVATVLTIWYQRHSDNQKFKMSILNNFLGSRNQLFSGESSNDFFAALSQIMVAFNKSEKVMKAYKECIEAIPKPGREFEFGFKALAESMCDDLHIKYDKLPTDAFTKVFYIEKK